MISLLRRPPPLICTAAIRRAAINPPCHRLPLYHRYPSCRRHLPCRSSHAMYCLTRLRSHNACLAMYQIRRTANAALEASTPSRRHRERGYGSSSRARSRSPPRSEPTRKHRRSRSPKYKSRSLSDRVEKRSRDAPQRPRCDKLEFFQSGAGPRGGACAVCLGRHEHTFSKCDGVKLCVTF